MASFEPSPLTRRRASFEAYSARYDETHHHLRSAESFVDIGPSKSNLAGSVDMTCTYRALTTRPPPPPPLSPTTMKNLTRPQYAASIEDAEAGNRRKAPQAVLFKKALRALQNLRAACRFEKHREHSERSLYHVPIKHTTFQDIEQHPRGWPQLAAFQNVDDRLLIFRSFNQVHCRTLQNLQCEIGCLEEKLQRLDKLDAIDPSMQYRLRTGVHEDDWDSAKKIIFRELEGKLQTYDDLLMKASQLTKLRNFPKKNSRDFLDFVWNNKPLDRESSEWYYHVDDLVLLSEFDDVTSAVTTACDFALNFLSICYTKLKCSTLGQDSNPKLTVPLPVSKYSAPSKALTAATHAVSASMAVGILLVPVLLLLWIPMNRLGTTITVSISMLIFAFIMGSFPKVRTQDVLIGTAGYCAVLATCLGNSRVG